jgi:hypothetical protein
VALISAADVFAPRLITETLFEHPHDLALEVMPARASALARCSSVSHCYLLRVLSA